MTYGRVNIISCRSMYPTALPLICASRFLLLLRADLVRGLFSEISVPSELDASSADIFAPKTSSPFCFTKFLIPFPRRLSIAEEKYRAYSLPVYLNIISAYSLEIAGVATYWYSVTVKGSASKQPGLPNSSAHLLYARPSLTYSSSNVSVSKDFNEGHS